MIKAIFFDLDNSIFDTSSMGEGVIESVREPLMHSTLGQKIKDGVSAALHTDPLNVVLERFAVPAEIGDAMRAAYSRIVLPPERNARTYGDEQAITALVVIKVLVTTGYEKFQRSKIERTGIAPLFDEIVIDTVDDAKKIRGKKAIFNDLLQKYKLDIGEVLVVGDNPRSELGAANELGIKTVQTLRPGVEKWSKADYHISSLEELKQFI